MMGMQFLIYLDDRKWNGKILFDLMIDALVLALLRLRSGCVEAM